MASKEYQIIYFRKKLAFKNSVFSMKLRSLFVINMYIIYYTFNSNNVNNSSEKECYIIKYHQVFKYKPVFTNEKLGC